MTLALLTAGEPPDSPQVAKALAFLRQFTPEQLRSVYAVSLQTMVFAAAEPERDQLRINLQRRLAPEGADQARTTASTGPARGRYTAAKGTAGRQLEHPVRPARPERGERGGRADRARGLDPGPELLGDGPSAATGAGPITPDVDRTGHRQHDLRGHLQPGHHRPEALPGAGSPGRRRDPELRQGGHQRRASSAASTGWRATSASARTSAIGQQWKYYYLYGLERAGRLTGQRFFGNHDWYREGAEELVHDQDKLLGFWQGSGLRGQDPGRRPASRCSSWPRAGRPVLINKLRHGPGGDWNNDPDDIRNLVGTVSRDWKHLLTWQVVDPAAATVEDLLQAPILYFNGHEAPEFTAEAKKDLRDYVEQGGFIMAEACCGEPRVRPGLPRADAELFPEEPSPAAPARRGPRRLAVASTS